MRQYRLTDEELESILNASKPVPYMIIGGHAPASSQENSNRAWQAVAAAHGFEWDSACDAGTGDNHDVLAEPLKPVEPLMQAVDDVNEKARGQ